MSVRLVILTVYFVTALPVLGGVLVAFGVEYFLDIPDLFALALGVAFGATVLPLSRQAIETESAGEAVGSVVFGTALILAVPLVTGAAYHLACRYGAFPALLVGFLAAVSAWGAVLATLAARVPQNLGDAILRGLQRGGLAAHARSLHKHERR